MHSINNFNELLRIIEDSNKVKNSDLMPFLSLESKSERTLINYKLAEAYTKVQKYHKAKIYIERAWIFSEFSPNILPLYIEINKSVNDIAAIKEAYKRLGIKKASENKIGEALECFNAWEFTHSVYSLLDLFEYDFDIIDCIKQMAKPYKFPRQLKEPLNGRKIRLAYLMFGMTQFNSVIVKICRIFAKYHDQDQFEVNFYVPEQESAVYGWGQALENMNIINNFGHNVVIAPNSENIAESLIQLANQIYKSNADILISCAIMADFKHYFITSMQPARNIIGFIQGPPPQFAAPDLDWAIAWTKHPLIDCPADCSLVELEDELPNRSSIRSYTRQQLSIQEDSLILVSAGRHIKFQEIKFWESIRDILKKNKNVYYLAIGISENQVPFLNDILTPKLKERLRLLEWREDYLNAICLADILIDTFPSGGGVILMDAMSLGIPVITFKNNYLQAFNQMDWSVGDEIVAIPELIIERGNFKQLKLLVSKLIDNQDYRKKMAKVCKDKIHLSRGNPERMVRKCESIYKKVSNRKNKEKSK